MAFGFIRPGAGVLVIFSATLALADPRVSSPDAPSRSPAIPTNPSGLAATQPATRPVRIIPHWELLPGAPTSLQTIVADQEALLKAELYEARGQRVRLQKEHAQQWYRAEYTPEERVAAEAWMEDVRSDLAETDRWIKELQDRVRPAMRAGYLMPVASVARPTGVRINRFRFESARISEIIDEQSAYVSFTYKRRSASPLSDVHILREGKPFRFWIGNEYVTITTPPLRVVGIDTKGRSPGESIEVSPFMIWGSKDIGTREGPAELIYEPFDPAECFRWIGPPQGAASRPAPSTNPK